MRRLHKNKEPPVNVVQIDKDVYEKQVKELRKKAVEKQEAKKKLKRMNKIVGNNRKIRFDEEEHIKWGDRMTEVDFENIKSVKYHHY